ncbi:T9SS type A sorting domain-containing protein [Hymenobacter negativus]|uniref:T9SS type A sorting domain-containing protein n=1 Tax=Hymenobacter negativus TaxID=2795026 RepID=A0ABS3QEN7_9BACT|nr:T9SS type A sorting domain-containing protein [Hymenobacter negativus]MBO2009710.1 T9SS type A sorting domain-containing protein [Hymenobacter negativus]
MKRLLTLALSLPALAATAQTLTNDGAAITVQSGATLYVAGGIQNKTGSTIANDGTVELTGDFTNAAAASSLSGAGKLRFSGSTDQTLTSPTGTSLAGLEVANTGSTGSNRVLVPADLNVTNQLTLTTGMVRTTPAAVITLPAGATLTGEATGRYVQGNLRAVAPVSGNTAVVFPNSATINANGTNLGTVTVTRTAGMLTAGVSYGQNLAGTTKGIDRVWTVAASGTQPSNATPATVAFSWLADNDNGFATGTNAQLWRSTSAAGPWGKMGPAGSAATRSFSANVTLLGALTISNISAPLPVELVSFTAEPQGADALLRWTTASEKNNDHFEVEASADGKNFRLIGIVAGHGTTTQASEYQLTDKAIAHYAADPVYYRLRQVDADGTASYSPVRQVRVTTPMGFAAESWPQPFGAEGTNLTLRTATAGPATVVVRDALGRLILSRTLDLSAGTTALSLAELGPLSSGVYMLRLSQGTQHAQLKLVRE